MFAGRRILFPEYAHDVPFRIANTPAPDGTLSAVRTFEFPERTRTMEDTMTVVDVRITAPLIGEVFRYAGAFAYAIRPAAGLDEG